MPKLPITIAAAAALCAIPMLSAAQMSGSSQAPTAASPMPGSPESAPPASTAKPKAATSAKGAAANTGTAANTSATGAALSAGMTVKDNTGVSIGQISKLDSVNGTQMATIKMGAQSFQVPAASLAAANGAATINLTQAQIQAQLPSK
ncbi:MAG TPA: hypothetical protein VGI30_06045 [Caulobacteraceae bacterium]|jgi:hypothetical protein